MTEYPRYFPENQPAPQADEKTQEAAAFRRLLNVIAVSVFITLGAKRLMAYLMNLGLEYVYTDLLERLPERVNAVLVNFDFIYFLMWTTNDIIVYLPPLVIFAVAMRDYMGTKGATGCYKADTRYEFKDRWLLPIFLASYALSMIASYISHLLAYFLQPVFGGGGLPDIFGEVMPQSTLQVFIAIFSIGIVAGVCEELIYRHYLLRPLRRFGDMQAVIITSLLFGFFHGNFTQFLYTTAVGFVYGVVAVKANSVLPAIALHIINNSYVVIMAEASELAYVMTEADERSLFTFVMDYWFWVMMLAGAVIFAFMCLKGMFKLENRSAYLTTSEKARVVAENPLILLLTGALIALTIIGTINR
jgi:membrane protease YdiL (CAAX protease family)